MSIKKADFFRYIKQFELKELFNELGWNRVKLSYPVPIDEQNYSLIGIAEKKNFVIFLCETPQGKNIPDSAVRRKIDNVIAKLHHEHLIIYADGNKTRQRWELLIREENKPVVCRPVDYYKGQEPELLFQKLEGLFFSFDDEEKLTIVDVRSRVMANFEKNAEVVTKKFYEKFSKEHGKFLGFIKGIQSKVDQEWYASLMLNRLMFIYFIQKKGFLDKNKDYLRTRLKAVQSRKGKDKFYSFYRSFLLVLFHKGLGSPLRDAEIEAEIGKVPYLNGGLFDVHKLEQENKNITIEDKAFERIFDFFDEYNWHLDTRVTATGKDINPDVIGYIFEKYINDRAAMGAYYTKEDITEYISKNCIVPWLFDEVKRNYPKPFSVGTHGRASLQGNIWSFLQHSGDTYIYPAVKHGIPNAGVGVEHVPPAQVEEDFSDLPEDVRSCIDPNTPDLVEKRKCWNRPAPPEIALPTEIYREVIARRKRYYEVRKKIERGEITEINNFITYNLNIRQFAQDVLEQTDDPKLIMEFYKAVRKITVLDPTCGSGAFLFAALNVLEPLYFACVTRMREFIEQDARHEGDGQGKPATKRAGRHKFFEEQIALIDSDDHPSEEYFIYKSIILHNLYGVDIMKEAVEIAKLRLFLKLVATCDVDYAKPNLGLEPLPDIDFNIRSGNTLVGYATLADLDKGEQGGLFGNEEKQAILEESDVVSRAYARFKDAQLVMNTNPKSYKDAKDDLNKRLTVLNDKLNKYLAVAYLDASYSKKAFDTWIASHQPFHWLAEYYWIIAEGGFDVIIGNPPFIEVRDIPYEVKGLRTLDTAAVHAMCVERSLQVSGEKASISMVYPMSLVSTQRMKSVQILLESEGESWYANFAWRPAKLFDEVNRAISILVHRPAAQTRAWSTGYVKWTSENRCNLIPTVAYVEVPTTRSYHWIPKFSNSVESTILKKMFDSKNTLSKFFSSSKFRVYYRTTGGLYWKVFTDFAPAFKVKGKSGHSSRETWFAVSSEDHVKPIVACLSSNLFWWWYTITSNLRDLNPSDIANFPVRGSIVNDETARKVGARYLADIVAKSTMLVREQKQTGRTETQSFKIQASKPIIDEIDKVLAKHYGFTPEELDFIINYDIKYRMGKELGGEDG